MEFLRVFLRVKHNMVKAEIFFFKEMFYKPQKENVANKYQEKKQKGTVAKEDIFKLQCLFI